MASNIKDLKFGFPNVIGRSQVFVMRATEGVVRLGVNSPGSYKPAVDYSLGDTVEIDDRKWRVIETSPLPNMDENAPPGTGSGTVVARLELEEA